MYRNLSVCDRFNNEKKKIIIKCILYFKKENLIYYSFIFSVMSSTLYLSVYCYVLIEISILYCNHQSTFILILV